MRYKIQGTARDENGSILAGATISVYLSGTTTPASIYATATSAVVINSVTSDSYGNYSFYYEEGNYYGDHTRKLVVSKVGYTSQTYDYHGPSDFVIGTLDDANIASTITAIGSEKATLFIRPGTWNMSGNVDWSSYTNITFKFAPGAIISHGAYTVKIPKIYAGLQQVFSGTGTVTLSKVKEAYPEWFGAEGDGTTDDTVAMQQTSDCGAPVVKLTDSYLLTANITVSNPILFDGQNIATIKTDATYTLTNTNFLLFDVHAINVRFKRIYFDTTSIVSPIVGLGFVVHFNETHMHGKVIDCTFIKDPDATGAQSAVAFRKDADYGEVKGCHFESGNGSVFSQAAHTKVHDNIVINPGDVSFVANGSYSKYAQYYNNTIFTTVAANHILAEEGASNFMFMGNTIYGLKNGVGIGALNVSVTSLVAGGIIANNIIDGNNLTATASTCGIYVSEYYSDVIVANNIVKNMPADAGLNCRALFFEGKGGTIIGNKFIEGTGINYTTSEIALHGGTVLVSNNTSTATHRHWYVTGDNANLPISFRGNVMIGGVYSIQDGGTTNAPFLLTDFGTNSSTHPIGGITVLLNYATTTQLTDKTATINTLDKYTGKSVYNTTTKKILYAAGDTATDHWYDTAGVDTHTPA